MDDKMITGKPLRPCAQPGCAELTRNKWCEKHIAFHRRLDVRPEEQQRWRRLYKTKRWKQMRAAQLLIRPFCVDCAEHGVRTRATDVDHIIDHKGDASLFFDASNLQSLCHSCHSRKTQAEQQHQAAAAPSPRGKKV